MLPGLCLLPPLSAAFFWVLPTPGKTPVYAAPSLPLADNDDRWMLSPSLYVTGIPPKHPVPGKYLGHPER
jgi:hypothetical protein